MSTVEFLVDAFNTFEQVGNVSSTNNKQEILTGHKDNQVMKSMLFSAYSPFIQYNIKKIPVAVEDCKGTEVSEQNYKDFLELLVKLSKREVTGNAAILALSDFLTGCCPEEYKWYSRIIEKDLAIGLADKGINKAFKGLIPTYEVLLADKIPPADLNLDTPKAMKLLPDRMVVQYKIDGYRLNIFVLDNGEVLIRTRNGKIVEGYNDLESEASEKLPKGYVYDGEMVAPELFDWVQKNVENGGDTEANRDLFSEVMSHAFSKEANKKGIFNMFDMVPIKEWNSQKTTQTLEQRTANINSMVKPLDLNHITIVPTSKVYLKKNTEDLAEIVDKFHHFLSIGWEGLMIKNWDAVYEFKRSKNLLKMKMMMSEDLVVTELFEGTGKYEGMMGGVYVDYKGYQVGVGSGWSDEQRRKYWDNKNLILGKTIEIAYQSESRNKDGGISLSFPVVKAVREDK